MKDVPDETAGRSRRRRRWPWRFSLSRSVLTALLAITALGLVLTGTLAHSLHDRAITERIDRDLAQEVGELRALASRPDPRTGLPFASVTDLLRTALERNVPSLSEEFLVTTDGTVPFVPATPRPLELETNAALLAELARIPSGAAPRYGTADHRGREIRYVAVPVSVPGDSARGVFLAAVDRTAERDSLRDTVRAQVLSGVLTLLLLAGVGALVFRRVLRPVGDLAQAAERVTDERLGSRVPVRGTDELARLARAFNRMLDRLDTAFRTQRALLDDVGHELRTPLTVLRGHLEMMDAGDPPDVNATRELLLDEIDRMGRLVDELVLLARSERPDFLVIAPVDVDDVVEGAFAHASTLAERDFRIDQKAHVVVPADRQRLTQALLALTSNAIRFTTRDDQIALGARAGADTVEIWVRDTGTGIEPADHERIFERFGRAGTPGREAGGTGHNSGLGLSIVAAIARAHGGRVDLVSAPGRGSVFTLVLPRRAASGRTTRQECP